MVGGLEWEDLDRLRDDLAASEDIVEVLHVDREVFHLKMGTPDLSPVEEAVAEALRRTGIVYRRDPW